MRLTRANLSLSTDACKSLMAGTTWHAAVKLRHNRVFAPSRGFAGKSLPDMQTSPPPPGMSSVLLIEAGVGTDQHGQDVTKACVRACKDAISFNSIPNLHTLVPGVQRRSGGCCDGTTHHESRVSSYQPRVLSFHRLISQPAASLA